MTTETVKTYHGHHVRAFVPDGMPSWHPYPWRFDVERPCGTKHVFSGVPNQCETRASALRRGWWRAKWMADGTFEQRYVAIDLKARLAQGADERS